MARKPKGQSFKANFGEATGGSRLVPDGIYTARIDTAELTESSAGNDMIKFGLIISEGKFEGDGPFFENAVLEGKGAFKLKAISRAIGIDVEDDDFDGNTDDYIGEELDVQLVQEEYEKGKFSSHVIACWPVGEGGGEPKDEEKPTKSSKKKAEPEDEEEEEKPARKRRAVKEEPEEEEEEEEKPSRRRSKAKDEDEEEEEEPKSKKTTSKTKVGSRVSFEDEKGKVHRGTITAISDEDCVVESKGAEWDLKLDEITVI